MITKLKTIQGKRSLSLGIGSSLILLVMSVALSVCTLTEKWPKPTLLLEYKSSLPVELLKVYFHTMPALLFDLKDSNSETPVQVFFDQGKGFNELHSYSTLVNSSGNWKEVRMELPNTLIYGLRLDPAVNPGRIGIRNVRIVDGAGNNQQIVPLSDLESGFQILSRSEENGQLTLETTPGANDPNLQIVFDKVLDLRVQVRSGTSSPFFRVDAQKICGPLG